MTAITSQPVIEVFLVSPQHEKEALLSFEKPLRMLQIRHYVSTWHNCSLNDLEHLLIPAPDTLSILLLFLRDSDDLSLPEIKHLRVLHDAGTIHLLPVRLSPVEIPGTVLEGLTILPTRGGPVSTWHRQETAWYEITLDLAYQIDVLRGSFDAQRDEIPISSNGQGDLAHEKALPDEATARKELEEDEIHFGSDHPRIAQDLELLAAIYRQQGQFERVVTLSERILAIQAVAYGPSHVYVIKALMELATLHQNQRQFAQAETYYLRLLALLEDHPGTLEESGLADLLIMIGDMYSQQRATEKLFPYYERAVSLLEQVYGPTHSDFVDVLSKMAIVASFEGRAAQAKQYVRRIIDGYEQAYGPEHPQLAEVLKQIAMNVYQSTGQFKQAVSLFQRALAMVEQIYGHAHPQVAQVLSALAHLYEDQKNLGQAILFARRALMIWESDPTDPRAILHGRNHLAGLYWDQGKAEEGAQLSRSLYDLMGGLPTLDDPDLIPIFENLARFSMDVQEYASAQAIYRRILTLQEKTYGSDHFELARTLNNLAVSYHHQRKYKAAEPFMKRAMAIAEEQYGADHPLVISARTNYRDLLLRLNRKSEAKKIDARLKGSRKRS